MSRFLVTIFLAVLPSFGAWGANLPPEPHPVDYVRICNSNGVAFFLIPGTDSCLRLHGRVRSEFRYRHQDEDQPIQMVASAGDRSDSPFFTRARAYWGFDHRTMTDIGKVRTFFRGYVDRDTADRGVTTLELDFGFVEISSMVADPVSHLPRRSLTLGFEEPDVEPVFNEFTLDHGLKSPGYDEQTLLAQYAHQFGNGVGASLVVLDPTVGYEGSKTRTVGRPTASVGFVPVAYGGLRIPTAGGALSYGRKEDGSFKQRFRLAGLLQDVRPANISGSDHALAWAVGLSGFTAVPFGNGTKIGFNAQYTEGILQFLHENTTSLPTGDFTVNAAGTRTKLSKGWSAATGLSTNIYKGPVLGLDGQSSFNFTGGYTDIRQNFGVVDVRWYDLAANVQHKVKLAWSGKQTLTLTAEVQYRNLSATGVRNSDGILGAIRAQLDF